MKRSIPQLLVSCGLLGALVAVSGCAEAKFCDKMRELYGEGQDDCEEDALPEIKAQCENPKEVYACFVKAADKEAARECKDVCKDKEKDE